MTSFFEKLKRGMGVEQLFEEKPFKKEKVPKPQKLEVQVKPLEVKEPEKKPGLSEKKADADKEKLFEVEGQLAIDVYQTKTDLVIQSAIAGVKPENLDISMEKDVVTIKGSREKPFEEEEGDYFLQECYWGVFSREIILPVEVDPNRATAEMKEGILTIRIPKIEREKKRKIVVKE